MKRYIFLSITLFILILTTGCGTARKNYIIFFDNSISVSEQTFDRYLTILQRSILPNLGSEDKITVQFIDECSLTRSERVYTLDLAGLNFEKRSDGLNNQKDSSIARKKAFIRDSVISYLRHVILEKRNERANCGNSTDIINALFQGSESLSKDKSYDGVTEMVFNTMKGDENYSYKNCIIIFSDMVNESTDKYMNFKNMHLLSEKEISEKIDFLKTNEKIPDLSSVEVFIYGATSYNEIKHANKQIENIRLFWNMYFAYAGAELKAYGFDVENEIKNYIITSNTY